MKNLPKNNKNDIIISVAKSIGGAVPFFGGLLGEALEVGLKPRLTTGMDIWMNEISDRLQKMEDLPAETIIKKLSENEEFISILIEASQRVMKTHLPQRKLILQNIVLNSLKEKYTFEEQTLFLTYLDRFSEVHIIILKYLYENYKFINGEASSGYKGVEIDDLISPKNPSVSYQIRKELSNLLFVDDKTIDDVGYSYLSVYGKQFYDYIMV